MPLSARFLQMSALTLTAALAGCKTGSHKPPSAAAPTSAPALQENWSSQPLAMPPQQARPVVEGPSPLVYLVESATMVRVADLTANEDLLRVPVPAKTLIAVSERTGISVGGATMKLGPLPEGHRFGIFLESSEENMFRSGTIRPGRPAKPGPSTRSSP